MNKKNLVMVVLLGVLLIGVMLINGCIPEENLVPVEEPQTQIENINPKEAYDLIQKNKNNPDFVILDVRTPEEFTNEHIENAINLDYYSETFKDDLNELDKNKTYVIYCKSGGRSGNALDIMEELSFVEVYNISGGITEWKAEGLPTIFEKGYSDITVQELMQKIERGEEFVLLDVRTPDEYAQGHIKGAILIPHNEIEKRYKELGCPCQEFVVYCKSGYRSVIACESLVELDFGRVKNLLGGIEAWKGAGGEIIKEEGK